MSQQQELLEMQNLENLATKGVAKRLVGYLRKHTKALLFAFLLLVLATAADVVGPIIIKHFIDDYLTPRIFDASMLVLMGGGYLVLITISVVLHYFQFLNFSKIAQWIIQQIRIDVFGKVHSLGLTFFDRTPAGSLVSRITNDTESIKELYVSVLSTFVQNIVFLIGIFISMFFLNVQLAFVMLALIPILLILMQVYRRLSSRLFHITRSYLSKINARLSESISGMNIIQAMRQEKRMRKEFEETNQSHFIAYLKQIKLNSYLVRPMVDLLYLLSLITVLGFFGFKSFNSIVEIGVLYAFINYLDRFFEPVNEMMFRLTAFQQAIVAAERVFGLMDDERLAPVKEGERDVAVGDGLVEFDNVTFSYDGKTDVLKNISFTAKPGETVALVGQTGSGKSSIINLLLRFYAVNKGEIRIDGASLREYEDGELRRKLGLVLQDPFLFVGDVKHNIRLHNAEIDDERVRAAAEFVQADTFIHKLPHGYEEPVVERGATFSSGQRQLLSFARTMAFNPKILVLDEATASVDTETEEAIQVALEKMRKGRTTIAIAHRLSTVQDADQILVLHLGEIVERGTHQQLLAQKGLYHKMYLLQQGALDIDSDDAGVPSQDHIAQAQNQ